MRTLSGIQPTGNLHLGNYLGAIRNWVRMQDEMPGEKLYFLADLHAITVYNDPAELTANTREMAAALLAAGIDPAKSILFNQARVPAHAELAWLLFCTARIGWLNRMTQFKEKSGKNREGASVGLFAYPVLQAADVLIYQTTHVPVGDDQKQHLELARDIATKFNLDTATETFTLPEPTIPAAAARIMSLRDGSAKMSKSDPSDASRINLVDDADTIMAKIRKAKTDAEPLPSEAAGLEGRAEARNLVAIYAAMADESVDQVLARFAGQGFGAFKPALGELLVETLRPIATRLNELKSDPAAIDAALEAGAARASALAKPTLDAAYAALGLCR
ncbi:MULTISPECIES: tryptophan--tRNA ligase [unclassified Sphingopyxis]|jgi:tryptophanyl-tRNA synthetase|uniref:tryptophan--tRNA ligase n=1 Tax=unclassified Sphingopyxis TaxID=2614943 RepID=UPI000730C495|nr:MULTISPECIES: tryptophan--tRNA ligase [unclassified Sphingopyxis]KTE03701.1 tryptophan--tRNA ligase [Sphingopyxis sp. H012]KTE09158.1 tryptophan--tRNA ligase [Sphingopyxis sp. H053]KTE14873.1 tryptophan--tRNA ligase [Sphingopyxis sp. H093]KTE29260.1 tryptophan--tRNA ligase [Sphingopyxis sp. H080]KTE35029.1 tryptophan--tRNA ligase [Sphingopyxis sp. H038]